MPSQDCIPNIQNHAITYMHYCRRASLFLIKHMFVKPFIELINLILKCVPTPPPPPPPLQPLPDEEGPKLPLPAPPTTSKVEIFNRDLFENIDKHASEVSTYYIRHFLGCCSLFFKWTIDTFQGLDCRLHINIELINVVRTVESIEH